MQFSIATLFAISAATVLAVPAPGASHEGKSLQDLHDIYSNALAQVEEVQAEKNGEVEKRQPGGLTCNLLGDGACWASCFAQTGCGGYCADETDICTCHSC